MTNIIYDGDKAVQLTFENSSYIDVAYAEFDNVVYSFNAFEAFVMRTTPNETGETVLIDVIDSGDLIDD